jgi:hypothetical protein
MSIVKRLRVVQSGLEFISIFGVFGALLAVIVAPLEGAKQLFLFALFIVIAGALGSVALSLILDVMAGARPDASGVQRKA